jgi:hypothetical protein
VTGRMRNSPRPVTDARDELIERMRASASEHGSLAEYGDSLRALEEMDAGSALTAIARWLDDPWVRDNEARRLQLSIRDVRARVTGTRGLLCEHCGRLFLATREHARFCSNACRQAAYRERRESNGTP